MLLIIEALKRLLFMWVTSMVFTVLEIKTYFLIPLKINLLALDGVLSGYSISPCTEGSGLIPLGRGMHVPGLQIGMGVRLWKAASGCISLMHVSLTRLSLLPCSSSFLSL